MPRGSRAQPTRFLPLLELSHKLKLSHGGWRRLPSGARAKMAAAILFGSMSLRTRWRNWASLAKPFFSSVITPDLLALIPTQALEFFS